MSSHLRTWAGIDASALHASIPLATFTHPSISVQQPNRAASAVRFLARWLAYSLVLSVAVLVLATAAHRILLGLWLHEGLLPETVVAFLAYLAALCLNVGFALTLTLNRIGRRGGRRHV